MSMFDKVKKNMKRLLAILMVLCTLFGTAQAGMYTGTALGAYTTPKCSHHWQLIQVTKEATCKKAGKGKFKCTKCGKTAVRTVARAAHVLGDWTVIKEATCSKKGKMSAVCQGCGKKITVNSGKALHVVDEWKIIRECTATKPGRRTGRCAVCGKKVTELFYPVGTIWGSSEPALIAELQAELRWLGFYTGEITGVWDDATAKAVKKLQKKYHLHVDGVAWPDTLALLGVNTEPGHPIGETDLSGYKLQLEVEMVSEPRAVYQAGDTVTFRWKLLNTSRKYSSKNTSVFLYDTQEPNKKTDLEIEPVDLLQREGSIEGTFEYTIAADTPRIGFVARGRLNKKEYLSNTVSFKFNIGE